MAIYRVPVRITHGGSGGDAYNILHIRTLNNDQEELQNAVDAIGSWYSSMANIYATSTTIRVGETVIRDPLGAPEYASVTPQTVVGTSASGKSPDLLALTVTWRTASATRSGRGRTFLGPVAFNTMEENGTVRDSLITYVQAAVQGFVDDSGTLNGWAIGVLSTKTGVLRDVTAFTVRDRWSYLSSRRD